MEQHYILCGLGRVGWHVLEYLQAAGLPVVVVDTRCELGDSRLQGASLIQGDCRRQDVLEKAGVASARGVLIMTNDDLANISTAFMVRHVNADARIVMRLFNQNLINRLGKSMRNVFALSTAMLTAPLFALSALTGQALGTIRLEGIENGLRQVAELTISAASPLRGRLIADLAKKNDLLVLAHLRRGGDRFLRDIDLNVLLNAGDRLIVCGEPLKVAPFLEGEEQVMGSVRWAGWLRRLGRVVWRTLAEVDLAVKVSGAVFLAVVVISTLILHFGVSKYHFPLAFFRTISLMATGGDMRPDDLTEDWQKVYVSVLRIFGAVLTAALTAIVTNYLLRARLAGALEVRRIPDSGHVVVCGLGNIGFRVVEELVKADEQVVVIELSRDSRFVTTARRLGVPVLIGDATVAAVLQQAHAVQARAVVAATSNDLVNLEVALMVRELNPTKRVVVHLSDPNLARTMREAANVRLALSIPTLAAPAFVAALFGDRVQNVFLIDGRMLAAVDLVIPAQDACLTDRTVRCVTVDYGLLPVAVIDPKGQLQSQGMNARLAAGCRLIALATLPDLQRLLRREPPRAEFAVDVGAFPLPTRQWLASLLRLERGVTAEAAEASLDRLPACVGTGLTRGQAEDLLALLHKERVTTSLRRLDGSCGV